MLKAILVSLGLTTSTAFAQGTPAQSTPAPDAQAAQKPRRVFALADLFSERNIVDAAISPSGRHLAAIVHHDDTDLLITIDLQTNERKGIVKVRASDAGRNVEKRLTSVYWKSDNRILFRKRVQGPGDRGVSSLNDISKLGEWLVAIDRDGSNPVTLLGDPQDTSQMRYVLGFGTIASFLPHDPAHIVMAVKGMNGSSLLKVDVESGHGELIEPPDKDVDLWWLDLDGKPVVRMTSTIGTVRFFRKVDGQWVQFFKMRKREMRERPEYEPLGPADQNGKYYVLARPPGRDRIGLYLYDIDQDRLGEPLIENPRYDLAGGRISRDGKRVLYHCYTADVGICEFADPRLNAHMRGLRQYFDEVANVHVFDSSQDGKTLLLFVEGPRDPPGFYYYDTDRKRVETVGGVQDRLADKDLPGVKVINYRARDGKELTGYLTTPANSSADMKLPLVMFPHGGPELRDRLTFDRWVQYFAARGYAVFQPNFRGSDGFGKAFADSGHGEWGRKMQDDISDAVKSLVDAGTVDAARICIVGASYGGYAALAGAALTPSLFKCAVSIAGISDLDDFIGWRKHRWGRDSEGYRYWLEAIGDPDRDSQRLHDVSPLRLVDQIKAPVLLIHGTDDGVVPIAQSRAMKKALDESGRKTELVEIKNEGHSSWSDDHEMLALSSIDRFLWKNLGAGVGVTTPPVSRGEAKP